MTIQEAERMMRLANEGAMLANLPPLEDLEEFIEANAIDIVEEDDLPPYEEFDSQSSGFSEYDMSPLYLDRDYPEPPPSPVPLKIYKPISTVYHEMKNAGYLLNSDLTFNQWEVSKYCARNNYQCVCIDCSDKIWDE